MNLTGVNLIMSERGRIGVGLIWRWEQVVKEIDRGDVGGWQ